MQRDIRDGSLYREAEGLYRAALHPSTGRITDASEVYASPNGRCAVFTGTLVDKLENGRATRLCQTNLASGDIEVITRGPHSDRSPKYSPNGSRIAFLSDRHRRDDFQLYLLNPLSREVAATPFVDGWVEYLHWSPDGTQILLGVAGIGADISGAHGSVRGNETADHAPIWMPVIQTGEESGRWRSVSVYDLATNQSCQVSPATCNVWEAVWCGNEVIAVISSSGPTEGHWYNASLGLIRPDSRQVSDLYRPTDQLGCPAASPSGAHVALVVAVCSDRCIVAGDLLVIDRQSEHIQKIDTGAIDVSYTEWRSDRCLLVAGHRGFETVVGVYDVVDERFCETWASKGITTAGRYVSVAGFGSPGDCLLVGESFNRSPEIAVIRNGQYETVRSLDTTYAEQASVIRSAEHVTWEAPDKLPIDGWLLLPTGQPPYPLITYIHGGPVWHWRPTWLGRTGAPILMLLRRGCAVFMPNPRGSGGRGDAFARQVVGDMGGADMHDLLSGIDTLVKLGVADAHRLGVIGHSYGGYMTAWLISHDSRFAAAVTSSPVTNFVTEHLLSNIPDWPRRFLRGAYHDLDSQYYERSPIMHAHEVETPTLTICGALDRSAPAAEAMQFHSALLENGVKSVLVIYPEEGHGIRRFPALIDYAARVVGWFEEHLLKTLRSP